MSQNSNNLYNFQIKQNVNSDQTSLVATLMSQTPTSIIKKTTTSSTKTTVSSCKTTTTTPQTTTTTTHSIKNSYNNNDDSCNSCRGNININSRSSSLSNLIINNTTTHHKKNLINPALVKRKHYSKVSSILWNFNFYFFLLFSSFSLSVCFVFNPLF